MNRRSLLALTAGVAGCAGCVSRYDRPDVGGGVTITAATTTPVGGSARATWARRYTAEGGRETVTPDTPDMDIKAVTTAPDGGFYLGGQRNDPDGPQDVLLFRTDAEGRKVDRALRGEGTGRPHEPRADSRRPATSWRPAGAGPSEPTTSFSRGHGPTERRRGPRASAWKPTAAVAPKPGPGSAVRIRRRSGFSGRIRRRRRVRVSQSRRRGADADRHVLKGSLVNS